MSFIPAVTRLQKVNIPNTTFFRVNALGKQILELMGFSVMIKVFRRGNLCHEAVFSVGRVAEDAGLRVEGEGGARICEPKGGQCAVARSNPQTTECFTWETYKLAGYKRLCYPGAHFIGRGLLRRESPRVARICELKRWV